MNKTKIVAHLPARIGSERIKQKNLRPLAGKPLIYYSIDAAKKSKKLDSFFVNTESEEIAQVAQSLGSKVYKRNAHLASAEITQDEFNYDFIKHNDLDILVLINPVCPLITAADIDQAIDYFLLNQLDSMVSCHSIKLHSFYQNKPLNFNTEMKLIKTQDLKPIQVCNWAIGIWDAKKFTDYYEKNAHAVFFGKWELFELSAEKSIKISDEPDFKIAEALIQLKSSAESL